FYLLLITHQSVNFPFCLAIERRAAEDPRFQNGKRIDTTRFLIADLPIRNARNPSTLNKISISNRQKNGIFLEPNTRHLNPKTCISNPCPPASWRGNSQELKTDATR